MSIHRVKRVVKGGGKGAPKKPVPPPPSLAGPNVSVRLFKPKDLLAFAKAAGLKHTRPAEGNVAYVIKASADAIDEAFSHYANGIAMHAASSSAGVRRDWCDGVAHASTNLLLSLGYSEPYQGLGRPAFNAMASLEKGWPKNPQTPENRAFLDQMKALFVRAVPDTYAATRSLTGEPNLDTCKSNLLGRLGVMLAAVSMLADSAERAWAAETATGGSGKARAREHMMKLLIDTFNQLFGRRPTAKPGSSGNKWFEGVITLAGDRARDEIGRFDPNSTTESQASAAALAAIAALACDIEGPVHGGGTQLDHWIREALKARDARFPGASQEPTPRPARSRRRTSADK